MKMLKQLFSGIYNLILGLLVTGKHLGRHAITLQYPKERWPMPERSRGIVVLLSNPETGKLNCTACLLCMKACPTAAIVIERVKNAETKKWEATKFVIDNTICCFCGMCEESCNFDALKLAGKYEFSVYDQSELIYDRDHLAEIGRDVPYTPTVKKKPAAKKPAAKPQPTPDKPAAEETKKAEPEKSDIPAKTEGNAKAPAKAGEKEKSGQDKSKIKTAPDRADKDQNVKPEPDEQKPKKDSET
jgi:NADH-quinone oxidoreductase subunit I